MRGALVLTFAALVIRVAVVANTVDVPGDGPSRATIAYEWSQAPYVARAGGWPPGFMYLAGAFTWLVPDPLVTSRVLNVLLGAATVPLFYALLARTFGRITAVVGAAALVVFPLHVHLSASSLTETSWLFEMVSGVELLCRAVASPRHRAGILAGALICFLFAEMTRYEAWVLVAPLPVYLWSRTGSRRLATAFAVALAAFPLAWTWDNAVYYGDAFVGFSAATNGVVLGTAGVPWTNALVTLAEAAATHLGCIALVALALGLLWQAGAALRRQLDAERALYLGLTAIYWLTMLRFAMARGETVYNRYLLFGFVFTLPYAVVWLTATGGAARRPAVHAALAILLGLVVACMVPEPSRAWPRLAITPWITTERPVAIERFSRWVADSPFTNRAILMTEMGWRSTYVPLFHHAFADRFAIVSDWHEDAFVRTFLDVWRPPLLLTDGGDEAEVARVERIRGAPIARGRVVYEADGLRAYELGADGESFR